ncbi:MAG: ABC transporter permease subunit [Hamadaea sp.]|nr:ABC transporter permease subunit [Hamadaea sp.]
MNAMTTTAALAAEWLKVRSVRSTWWSLAAVVAVAVAMAAFIGATFRANIEGVHNFDAVFPGLYGLTVAQLALVVFAVLTVGSEYTSGSVKASLAAVPVRGRFLAAKLAVVGLVAFAVAVPSVLGAFAMAQWALGPYGTTAGADGVPAALLGAIAYLPLIALIAAGVTTMVRHSAIALGVLIPILFLGSQGLASLPGVRTVLQYLPDQAGMVLMRVTGPPDDGFGPSYGPATAIVVLLAWTCAAVAGGYLVLRRRDA